MPVRTRTQAGRRGGVLIGVASIVLLVAACGRASEAEINQALGITPSPTLSAERLATGTAAAQAAAATRAAAAASPGSGGQVAAVGDVSRGSRQFTTWCFNCHGPAGAVKLLEPGGPGAAVTAENLLPLLRDAPGHAVPPGPYTTTEIPDAAVADLAAYILSKAAP